MRACDLTGIGTTATNTLVFATNDMPRALIIQVPVEENLKENLKFLFSYPPVNVMQIVLNTRVI